MGLDCSRPTQVGELYLPSDTLRVCNPRNCWCGGGHHRRARHVYIEHSSDGRETYRDPVYYMEKALQGGGLPMSWKDPQLWTNLDFDALEKVMNDFCDRRRARQMRFGAQMPWTGKGVMPEMGMPNIGPPYSSPGWNGRGRCHDIDHFRDQFNRFRERCQKQRLGDIEDTLFGTGRELKEQLFRQRWIDPRNGNGGLQSTMPGQQFGAYGGMNSAAAQQAMMQQQAAIQEQQEAAMRLRQQQQQQQRQQAIMQQRYEAAMNEQMQHGYGNMYEPGYYDANLVQMAHGHPQGPDPRMQQGNGNMYGRGHGYGPRRGGRGPTGPQRPPRRPPGGDQGGGGAVFGEKPEGESPGSHFPTAHPPKSRNLPTQEAPEDAGGVVFEEDPEERSGTPPLRSRPPSPSNVRQHATPRGRGQVRGRGRGAAPSRQRQEERVRFSEHGAGPYDQSGIGERPDNDFQVPHEHQDMPEPPPNPNGEADPRPEPAHEPRTRPERGPNSRSATDTHSYDDTGLPPEDQGRPRAPNPSSGDTTRPVLRHNRGMRSRTDEGSSQIPPQEYGQNQPSHGEAGRNGGANTELADVFHVATEDRDGGDEPEAGSSPAPSTPPSSPE